MEVIYAIYFVLTFIKALRCVYHNFIEFLIGVTLHAMIKFVPQYDIRFTFKCCFNAAFTEYFIEHYGQLLVNL